MKYESFTEDFTATAKQVLGRLDLDYDHQSIKTQAEQFDARHGMWQEWEDWQYMYFSAPTEHAEQGKRASAEEINRLLGYGEKSSDADSSWRKSLPAAS